MTNELPLTELTTKGQQIMLLTFAEAQVQEIMQRERKALRRASKGSPIAFFKARSFGEMQRLTTRGWKVEENLSLGRGAGFQMFRMSMPTEQLRDLLKSTEVSERRS